MRSLATLLVALFALAIVFSVFGLYDDAFSGRVAEPVQSIGGGSPAPGDISCRSDIQCPVDRYIGSYYCRTSDVHRDYRDFYCDPSGFCASNVSSIVIDYCGAGEQCVEGQGSCQTVFSCSDSDGGLNYTLRGHTTGVNATGAFDNYDYCISRGLNEQWCDGVNPRASQYLCPESCSNGACVGDTTPPFYLLASSASSSRVNSTSSEIDVNHLSADFESLIYYRQIQYKRPGDIYWALFAVNYTSCSGPVGTTCSWRAARRDFTVPGNYSIQVSATSSGGTSYYNISTFLS